MGAALSASLVRDFEEVARFSSWSFDLVERARERAVMVVEGRLTSDRHNLRTSMVDVRISRAQWHEAFTDYTQMLFPGQFLSLPSGLFTSFLIDEPVHAPRSTEGIRIVLPLTALALLCDGPVPDRARFLWQCFDGVHPAALPLLPGQESVDVGTLPSLLDLDQGSNNTINASSAAAGGRLFGLPPMTVSCLLSVFRDVILAMRCCGMISDTLIEAAVLMGPGAAPASTGLPTPNPAAAASGPSGPPAGGANAADPSPAGAASSGGVAVTYGSAGQAPPLSTEELTALKQAIEKAVEHARGMLQAIGSSATLRKRKRRASLSASAAILSAAAAAGSAAPASSADVGVSSSSPSSSPSAAAAATESALLGKSLTMMSALRGGRGLHVNTASADASGHSVTATATEAASRATDTSTTATATAAAANALAGLVAHAARGAAAAARVATKHLRTTRANKLRAKSRARGRSKQRSPLPSSPRSGVSSPRSPANLSSPSQLDSTSSAGAPAPDSTAFVKHDSTSASPRVTNDAGSDHDEATLVVRSLTHGSALRWQRLGRFDFEISRAAETYCEHHAVLRVAYRAVLRARAALQRLTTLGAHPPPPSSGGVYEQLALVLSMLAPPSTWRPAVGRAPNKSALPAAKREDELLSRSRLAVAYTARALELERLSAQFAISLYDEQLRRVADWKRRQAERSRNATQTGEVATASNAVDARKEHQRPAMPATGASASSTSSPRRVGSRLISKTSSASGASAGGAAPALEIAPVPLIDAGTAAKARAVLEAHRALLDQPIEFRQFLEWLVTHPIAREIVQRCGTRLGPAGAMSRRRSIVATGKDARGEVLGGALAAAAAAATTPFAGQPAPREDDVTSFVASGSSANDAADGAGLAGGQPYKRPSYLLRSVEDFRAAQRRQEKLQLQERQRSAVAIRALIDASGIRREDLLHMRRECGIRARDANFISRWDFHAIVSSAIQSATSRMYEEAAVRVGAKPLPERRTRMVDLLRAGPSAAPAEDTQPVTSPTLRKDPTPSRRRSFAFEPPSASLTRELLSDELDAHGAASLSGRSSATGGRGRRASIAPPPSAVAAAGEGVLDLYGRVAMRLREEYVSYRRAALDIVSGGGVSGYQALLSARAAIAASLEGLPNPGKAGDTGTAKSADALLTASRSDPLRAQGVLPPPSGRTLMAIAEQVFSVLDPSDEGVIDFVELLLGLARFVGGTLRERLELLYDVYDADGDGQLELMELIQVILNGRAAVVADRLGARRGSTSSGLDIGGLGAGLGGEGLSFAAELARLLDRNGDGLITRDEFVTALQSEPVLLECLGDAMTEQYYNTTSKRFDLRTLQKIVTRYSFVPHEAAHLGRRGSSDRTGCRRASNASAASVARGRRRSSAGSVGSVTSDGREQQQQQRSAPSMLDRGISFGLFKQLLVDEFDCPSDALGLAARVFAIFDTDDSGQVDIRELYEGMMRATRGPIEDRARFFFELFDTDHSGVLETAEIHAMMMVSQSKDEIGEEEARSVLNALDADRSGSIELSEWIEAIQMQPSLLTSLSRVFGKTGLFHEEASDVNGRSVFNNKGVARDGADNPTPRGRPSKPAASRRQSISDQARAVAAAREASGAAPSGQAAPSSHTHTPFSRRASQDVVPADTSSMRPGSGRPPPPPPMAPHHPVSPTPGVSGVGQRLPPPPPPPPLPPLLPGSVAAHPNAALADSSAASSPRAPPRGSRGPAVAPEAIIRAQVISPRSHDVESSRQSLRMDESSSPGRRVDLGVWHGEQRRQADEARRNAAFATAMVEREHQAAAQLHERRTRALVESKAKRAQREQSRIVSSTGLTIVDEEAGSNSPPMPSSARRLSSTGAALAATMRRASLGAASVESLSRMPVGIRDVTRIGAAALGRRQSHDREGTPKSQHHLLGEPLQRRRIPLRRLVSSEHVATARHVGRWAAEQLVRARRLMAEDLTSLMPEFRRAEVPVIPPGTEQLLGPAFGVPRGQRVIPGAAASELPPAALAEYRHAVLTRLRAKGDDRSAQVSAALLELAADARMGVAVGESVDEILERVRSAITWWKRTEVSSNTGKGHGRSSPRPHAGLRSSATTALEAESKPVLSQAESGTSHRGSPRAAVPAPGDGKGGTWTDRETQLLEEMLLDWPEELGVNLRDRVLTQALRASPPTSRLLLKPLIAGQAFQDAQASSLQPPASPLREPGPTVDRRVPIPLLKLPMPADTMGLSNSGSPKQPLMESSSARSFPVPRAPPRDPSALLSRRSRNRVLVTIMTHRDMVRGPDIPNDPAIESSLAVLPPPLSDSRSTFLTPVRVRELARQRISPAVHSARL